MYVGMCARSDVSCSTSISIVATSCWLPRSCWRGRGDSGGLGGNSGKRRLDPTVTGGAPSGGRMWGCGSLHPRRYLSLTLFPERVHQGLMWKFFCVGQKYSSRLVCVEQSGTYAYVFTLLFARRSSFAGYMHGLCDARSYGT